MSFDSHCPEPPSGLEVPTLKSNEQADPCDRTDYGAVEEMAAKAGTSEKMHAEAEAYFKELKMVNQKFNLGTDEDILRGQSIDESQLAYDLHQYQVASPGVFRVEYRPDHQTENDEIGSGFAVREDGQDCLIITDHHVVASDSGVLKPNLQVKSKTGISNPATVEMLDAKTDLALLSVPTSDLGGTCPVLPLAAKADNLKPYYDRVTAVGHPGGAAAQFLSGGEVLRVDRKHSEIEHHPDGDTKPWKDNVVVEVGAHVIGGNSGGPAMANGEVVGATQYKRGSYEMFFTPAEDIRSLLVSHRASQAKIARGPQPYTPEFADIDCGTAREQIRQKISSGMVEKASFSGYQSRIKGEYTFNDGTQYIMEEFKSSCQKKEAPLTS